MKNLSQFKKRLQVGQVLETIHSKFGSYGERPVSIVQSNSFALKTTKTNGEITDSWCEFPKASNIEFPNENTAVIYWGEGDKREQILTYIFK
jgi:hypothetical protein